MTMPFERTQSVVRTRIFLRKLLDAKQSPRVPSHIRREAQALLRHYPENVDLHLLARHVPDWWSAPDELSP